MKLEKIDHKWTSDETKALFEKTARARKAAIQKMNSQITEPILRFKILEEWRPAIARMEKSMATLIAHHTTPGMITRKDEAQS